MKPSTGDYQTAERMAAKLAAVPLPDLAGKTVLDVGCDHGAWCFLASDRGAARVLGVDRGRHVRGQGFVDLAKRNQTVGQICNYSTVDFHRMELGSQYHELGRFDVVLMLSCYHHAYQATGGDHSAVWYWLWRHTRGELLWENPTSLEDPVAAAHVKYAYREPAILAAAEQWFHVEQIGRGHVATRSVWKCTPKAIEPLKLRGIVKPGAGGASKAFSYRDGRRVGELEDVLGIRAYPGSLNVYLETPFEWDRAYYRARVLDVVDRAKGLEGDWLPRSVRLYPIKIAGTDAYVFRFEGESYPPNFVEIVAGERLRDLISSQAIELEH